MLVAVNKGASRLAAPTIDAQTIRYSQSRVPRRLPAAEMRHRDFYDRPALCQSAAAATFLQLEADWEAAYLLTLQSAWMADNRRPNSMEASMAKAKAGRTGTDVTLRCVELAGTVGYSEAELLEKWGRDSKILDIFEGTQQIQQLIVARRILGLSSAELK